MARVSGQCISFLEVHCSTLFGASTDFSQSIQPPTFMGNETQTHDSERVERVFSGVGADLMPTYYAQTKQR